MSWDDALFAWLPDPKETERNFSYIRRKRNGSRERVEAAYESYCFPGDANWSTRMIWSLTIFCLRDALYNQAVL